MSNNTHCSFPFHLFLPSLFSTLFRIPSFPPPPSPLSPPPPCPTPSPSPLTSYNFLFSSHFVSNLYFLIKFNIFLFPSPLMHFISCSSESFSPIIASYLHFPNNTASHFSPSVPILPPRSPYPTPILSTLLSFYFLYQVFTVTQLLPTLSYMFTSCIPIK